MHGTNEYLIARHLIEYWYHSRTKYDLFERSLGGIKKMYT